MKKETIIRMAREAGGLPDPMVFIGAYERFAALVAAAERNSWPAEMEAMERQVNILTDALAQAKAEEREACAKYFDDHWREQWSDEQVAAHIRARGQQ